MRRKIILSAVVSGFALGACGVKGDLKTPPPLWGDGKAEQPETKENTNEQSAPDETNSDGS